MRGGEASFVAQRLDGFELGGTRCGKESGEDADHDREDDSSAQQPPGRGPKIFWRHVELAKIDIRTEVDGTAEQPSEGYAEHSARESHHSSLGEEDDLNVTIAGADGLHDADLAAAFENGHQERVHDAERGDDQREAAEDPQEDIEHGEEATQALGGVEDGEGVEAHLADGVLHTLYLRCVRNPDSQA